MLHYKKSIRTNNYGLKFAIATCINFHYKKAFQCDKMRHLYLKHESSLIAHKQPVNFRERIKRYKG